MTQYELKRAVEGAGTSPHFFTRVTMRFFGDTMKNYGVTGPFQIVNNAGATVLVYELFRRRPVRHGNTGSAFFNAVTFKREFPAQ